MKVLKSISMGVGLGVLLSGHVFAAPVNPTQGLAIAQGQFTFNGKPFRIISGEMHYTRVPREYWRDRKSVV